MIYYEHMAHKKEVRKIIQNGRGSYYINIPKDLKTHLGWRERQKLTLKIEGDKLVVRDWEE